MAASARRRADRTSLHHRAARVRGPGPPGGGPRAFRRTSCRPRAHAALERDPGGVAGRQGHRFRREVLALLVTEAERFRSHRCDGRAAARAHGMSPARWDAVVVGAGPNGLMAAITLGRAGMATLLLEAESTPGGACRSAELTLPGFTHDLGAAVHLFALAAPALRSVPFENHGTSFVHGVYPLAHPLDDGSAVLLQRSVSATADGLGQDARAYEQLFNPLLAHMEQLLDQFLGPPLRPRHPVLAAGFAKDGLLPLTVIAGRFKDQRARALLIFVGAHLLVPLNAPPPSAIALL